MRRICHEVRAAADKHAKRRVELPRAGDPRCHEQARAHQAHTAADDDPRAMTVHNPPDSRAENSGNQEAKGKSASHKTSVPPETHRSMAATAVKRRCAPSPRLPWSRKRPRRSTIHNKTAAVTANEKERASCDPPHHDSSIAFSGIHAGSSSHCRVCGRAASRAVWARTTWDIDTRHRAPPPRCARTTRHRKAPLRRKSPREQR
jgi:hypothetical protein